MAKVVGDPFLLAKSKQREDGDANLSRRKPSEQPHPKRTFRDLEFFKLPKD